MHLKNFVTIKSIKIVYLILFNQDHNKILANVKVLPEITLGPPFLDQRLASLDHLRVFPDSETDMKKQKKNMKKQERVENLDAAVTAWPAWVYRLYDPKRLSFKIRQHLQFLETSKLQLQLRSKIIYVNLTFIVICYVAFHRGW